MSSTKAILARAAKFITDLDSNTDWSIHTAVFDVEDIANNVTRLYRSQTFGDPDYTSCVYHLFQGIADKDEKLAINFVKYIISNDFDLGNEQVISKDPELLQSLHIMGASEINIPTIPDLYTKYVDVKILPGDFYIELQEQINKAFIYGILPAVQILSRKFLENLLIDILRKKYGVQNIELFYEPNRGRFHGFEHLLRTLDERIDDFEGISPTFNSKFLSDVNKFRDHGNSSAHTIELNLDKDDIKKDGTNFEFIVKLLVRVFESI